MAYHLEDQKSPLTCKLLAAELERVINEEIKQRDLLLQDGVRDVTEYIDLPPNKVDQLDEDSANYDDKRNCLACKHICFFSCVACECSKSKVSCLRHSHFMCRCPTEKRYLMLWSTKAEMEETLTKVKEHLKILESKYIDLTDDDDDHDISVNKATSLAPGAEEDAKNHSGYFIDVTETSPLYKVPRTGQRLIFFYDENQNFSLKLRETLPDDFV